MNLAKRKLYRILFGVFFTLLAYFGGWGWPIAGLGFCLALLVGFEYERRLHPGLYGWIATRSGGILKEQPGFFLSDTYFVLAIFFLFVLLPDLNIPLAALLFLTFGDAASTLAGSRFGRVRIYRRKTLEGFLACLAVTTLLAWLLAGLPRHSLDFGIGFAGAVTASLAELFDLPPDDNFSVPVLSALVMLVLGFFV